MPHDPGLPEEEETQEKKPTSQGKSGGKKDTSKRDGKEKTDRGATRFQENASEGTAPAEDVFKKPLPPTMKKEESPPPVRHRGGGGRAGSPGKERSKAAAPLALCLTKRKCEVNFLSVRREEPEDPAESALFPCAVAIPTR